MAKNLFVTYVLWLVGGWYGLHHLYLGRDRHALVWTLTLGGCFGLGWVRDMVCIPDYVHDANDDKSYLAELRHRMKMDASPPFHLLRFFGEMVVGMLFALVVRSAIPEHIIEPHHYLDLFIPISVGTGVWLVGCIGHEYVSLKLAILGAYGGLPVFYNDPSNLTYMALFSAILTNVKGKSWQLEMPKRHVCTRMSVLSLCVLLYASLWCSAIYHNASVTTSDGETIKMSEAFQHFYNSPAWEETKGTLWLLWSEFLENGPRGFYDEFVMALDPEGEVHAYRLLGVQSGASEKEVTTAYRKLVREWHPDKHTDERSKKVASAEFMKIQQAYETLSQIKSRRAQRNTRQRSRDDEL